MEIIEKENPSLMFFPEICQKLSTILNNSDYFTIDNKLIKPLWKAFLFNDGSMTVFLNNLLNNNLQFQLISSEIHSITTLPELDLIYKLTGLSIDGKMVKRIINFHTDNQIIMEAISYWNADIYKEVFGDNLNAPIGKVMIEKNIEYFRRIKTIYRFEDKFIRFSYYVIRGKQAFLLLEILYEGVLNNFLC